MPVKPGAALEYLFDPSSGRGESAFSRWPEPPVDAATRYGYAGGISPETIGEALAFASQHADAGLWIDMESGVRTEDDRFDLDKVEGICARVQRWRRATARSVAPARSDERQQCVLRRPAQETGSDMINEPMTPAELVQRNRGALSRYRKTAEALTTISGKLEDVQTTGDNDAWIGGASGRRTAQ